LRQAVSLAPDEPLIRITLAQALLATPNQQDVDEAISNLRIALARETSSAMGYRQLALAYARKGDAAKGAARRSYLAQADLASAEAYFYEGRLEPAKQFAKRAQTGFAEGTPDWFRADEILAFELPKGELARRGADPSNRLPSVASGQWTSSARATIKSRC